MSSFQTLFTLKAVPSRRPSAMEVPEVPFLSSFQKNQQSSQKYDKKTAKTLWFMFLKATTTFFNFFAAWGRPWLHSWDLTKNTPQVPVWWVIQEVL